MIRIRILPAVLVIAFHSAFCLTAGAQTPVGATPASKSVHEIGKVREISPLATENASMAIEVRYQDEMTQEDRKLLADAQSSIEEHARFWGLDLNQGKWTSEQMLCSALPGHLLLRYSRNGGAGDVSIFSVSVARTGGAVRIIPVQRRGFSLFSPAPVNSISIATFNKLLSEDHAEAKPDWIADSLCYGALTGSNAEISLLDQASGRKTILLSSWTATVTFPVAGGASVQFIDVDAKPNPFEWTLTYDAKGKLLKAEHNPILDYKSTRILPATEPLKSTVLPPTVAAPQK